MTSTHAREDERTVFEIPPGMLERTVQSAIDDLVARYGSEARHIVFDCLNNALDKRTRRQ